MNKNLSCDASVLINFLKINRIDLLEKCSYSFFITDHVEEEISVDFPAQRNLLEFALDQKTIQTTNVSSLKELELFAELTKTRQLGSGECASIAVATRGWDLAIDDNQAIKKAILYLKPDCKVVRTQDLVTLMIHEGLIEIEEADNLIQVWAKEHRFKLKIRSFNELITL